MNIEELNKQERSTLCYLETCAVDAGGLVEAQRMNQDDYNAIARFMGDGILQFGRIPAALLGTGANKAWTHWVVINPIGWPLVSECRQLRAKQHGTLATKVFATVAVIEPAGAK